MPSFAYPGGKARIRNWLVRRMPLKGRRYVEPCVGRGNIFWLAAHVLDFREWWLNDPLTARWLEAIRDVDIDAIPNELSRALVEMYWRNSTKKRETDDVAVALETLTLWAGGGREINPRCHQKSIVGFKRRILRARSIMRSHRPRITSEDWRSCGLKLLTEDDFVYIDPPYMNATIRYYTDKMDHEALLRHLVGAKHLWLISGYPSELYNRHLGAPDATRKVKRSVCITSKVNKADTISTECLWTNYTLDVDGSACRKQMKRRTIRKKRLAK